LTLVSGASIQDGKFAVIRGLPDRYVSSQMNGVRLPSADEDKRAVELDQFPSAVIESLQVSKTFTPDQQGDASGGAVNVRLKGIPDENSLTFKHQYSYNTQVTGRHDFLTYKGKSSWNRLPILVRIELMFELTGSALDHADSAKALALSGETKELVKSVRWLAEDHISLTARSAVLLHRAGEHEQARGEIKAALAMFDAQRAQIADIYRASALRSVALALQSMGDVRGARELYARAVEEGIANPNSRPRAEDLSATCCSMALNAVEPDAKLWARLRAIRSELKAPW